MWWVNALKIIGFNLLGIIGLFVLVLFLGFLFSPDKKEPTSSSSKPSIYSAPAQTVNTSYSKPTKKSPSKLESKTKKNSLESSSGLGLSKSS